MARQLVLQKVIINNRWYTIQCTENQQATVNRLGARVLSKQDPNDQDDYETIVKLLLNVHRRRKNAED